MCTTCCVSDGFAAHASRPNPFRPCFYLAETKCAKWKQKQKKNRTSIVLEFLNPPPQVMQKTQKSSVFNSNIALIWLVKSDF